LHPSSKIINDQRWKQQILNCSHN